MLIEFSVANFLSFKEKAVFSMLAGSDKEHEEKNVVTLPNGIRLLKSAVIYGANASGKSNLLKAMDFVATFVNNSHIRQINEPIGVIPFLLDDEMRNKPSEFQVIFYADNIKYSYGFSCTPTDVIEEYLYFYPNGREAIIFERENINQYHFTTDISEQEAIKSKNTNNKLYISTAAMWNYEKVNKPLGFLTKLFMMNDLTARATLADIKKYSIDAETKTFDIMKRWVKTIDVGISDIEIADSQSNSGDLLDRIMTVHIYSDKEGNEKQILFKYNNESDGTKQFILNSAYILVSLYVPWVKVIIDELDCHLHPLLSRFIIEQFHNKETNYMNQQLIFTTHDTNLLDLSLFRRDQIYFTQKNEKSGATDLYSLDEFSVRKDARIEKGYLMGKFGAIPFIGGEFSE